MFVHRGKHSWVLLALSAALASTRGFAVDQDFQLQRVPDEIETTGDHANGLANGGSAAVSGLNSVRQNPAMLSMERMYKVTAGYNWPSEGREFFNAGIVDGTTMSGIAAGVSYTSFADEYQQDWAIREGKDGHRFDSAVDRRLAAGVAQTLGKVSVGVNGQYVQGVEENPDDMTSATGAYEETKGAAFGLGVAGLLTPAFRFGASAENLANGKIKEFAPTTYRLGLAYLLWQGQVSLHLDGVQRERVLLETRGESMDPERMAIASFSVKFYEFFRILGAYGREIGGERESLSGGIALVNEKFSISYTQRQAYLGYSENHQAVNFGMVVSL